MAAYESDLDFYQTSYTFEEIEAREAFRENCIARKLYEQVKMSCKGIVDDMSFEIMRRCGVKPFFPKKRKTFTFEDGSQIRITNDEMYRHLIPSVIYNLD